MEKTNKIEKTYYARRYRQSYYVPVLGPDGKPVYKKHPTTDALIYVNNKLKMLEELRFFDVISQSGKLGMLCKKTTADPVEIKVLDALAAQRDATILTEEEYKKQKNPDLFARETELVAHFEADTAAKDQTIADLKRKLEEAQRRNK